MGWRDFWLSKSRGGTGPTVDSKADELQKTADLLRQMREALDSSSIVSMTDVRGIITYANDNFCSISKYLREEMLGQNHRILKSGLHPKEYYADMWHTIARGKVWKGELCNRAKDGSFYWVYATIFPFLRADGKPESYMGIRHDITQLKRTEEELRRSNQVLEEFDHVVAHELKTPLTIIKMAAENLTDAGLGCLSQAQATTVGIIDKNVDQMVSIINGLLSLAQYSATGKGLGIRNLNAKRHAVKVLQGIQPIADEKNVAIRNEIPEDIPPVKGSPGVFAEILGNLMSNALRHASHEVVVTAQQMNGKIRFGVYNDGPSIPKAQMSGLFEKFASDNQSQSPLFKGSGLGLYICKTFVTQMDGEIWGESEEGNGVCFYFTLPVGGGDGTASPA